jgi:hypothetical protein
MSILFVRSIENKYLGLENGILDPSAILLSRCGYLTFMDCKVILCFCFSTELVIFICAAGYDWAFLNVWGWSYVIGKLPVSSTLSSDCWCNCNVGAIQTCQLALASLSFYFVLFVPRVHWEMFIAIFSVSICNDWISLALVDYLTFLRLLLGAE